MLAQTLTTIDQNIAQSPFSRNGTGSIPVMSRAFSTPSRWDPLQMSATTTGESSTGRRTRCGRSRVRGYGGSAPAR